MKEELFYLIPIPAEMKDSVLSAFPELAKQFQNRKVQHPHLLDFTEPLRTYQKNDEPLDQTLARIIEEWKLGKKNKS